MDMKLELVGVPVTDVDRAKAFYVDQVGFNADHDHVVSDTLRFVQLTPPGSGCSITIGTGITDAEPGSVRGIQITVDDIDDARAHLIANGVDAGPVQHFSDGVWSAGKGGPWNSFVRFSDPDGNGWVLQERPSA